MAVDTPAVVLGAGLNGLGVARSLAQARVPVWLLDTDARRPEMHTRAARSLRIGALHGETLIEELVRLGTTQFSGVRPVLFVTQEESVKTVSQYREQLSPLYRFSLPPREIVDQLLHKYGFQRRAEQLGGPIPSLVRIRTHVDLPLLADLHYPVVVKPGERNPEYSGQFKKAYRADSVAEATELIRRILAVMADVVVQEWIEGPDSNIYFCLQYLDQQHHAVASCTGRKIRSWPPQVGGTASCVAAPEAHAELCTLTARFFQAAGVIGMASMEYKRDSRSGEWRMVEPTIGRTDYQEEVATLNGVNLPYAAWCTELGLPHLPVMTMQRPIAWYVRSEDRQSAAAQNQRPSDGFVGIDGAVDALWRWSDPLPRLIQGWHHVQRALTTRLSQRLPKSPAARSKT